MDIIDQAQRLEQAERDHMIKKTTAMPERAGSETCIDCDVVIPAQRRKMVPGAVRCVDCQGQIEGRSHGRS